MFLKLNNILLESLNQNTDILRRRKSVVVPFSGIVHRSDTYINVIYFIFSLEFSNSFSEP